MEYTLEDKYKLIKEELLSFNSKNPIDIFNFIMSKDYVNIHGPEHHFLDGAVFLTAYKNVGGNIDLQEVLDLLSDRTMKMPGAMCGYWGVCGSVTSIGAALSIINQTTPLSSNDYYKDNMEFTSIVINKMSEIGGPRCCKRNAFISLSYITKFVKDKYGIEMEEKEINCEYSQKNKQCITLKCPFFKL